VALDGAVAELGERARGGAARRERQFRIALAVAGVLHAAMVFAASRQKLHQTAHVERPDFFDVALIEPTQPEEAVGGDPAHASEAARSEQAGQAAPDRVARIDRTTHEPDSVIEPVPVPESPIAMPEVETPPAGAGSAASVAPSGPPGSMSLDALGIGSNPFLGMRGIGVPTAAPPPPPVASAEAPDRTRVAERRVKQYLVSGMLEHDRAVGASRSGPVVTALHDAATLISSPVNGQAEFVATVDATGLVVALRPVRVTSGAAEWRNVAAQALKQLAKKRLRVPAGATGLEVRLALSSRIQLPSGSSSMGTLHQDPFLSKDGSRLSRLELPPESRKLPDQQGPAGLGTPLLQQPIPGGGVDGDLSDIGGVSRRIVHVTITDERPL
jgi:hypothetical protein